MRLTKDKIIKMLYEALTLAKEHLDYCGYGDAWEREAAEHQKLPETIAEALEKAKKYIK